MMLTDYASMVKLGELIQKWKWEAKDNKNKRYKQECADELERLLKEEDNEDE